MTPGNIREDAINQTIAYILGREDGWTAQAERTGRVVGSGGARPDIIVDTNGGAIIIETEYHPAATLRIDVEKAASREIRGQGMPVAVVGVVIPREIRNYEGDDMAGHISKRRDLSYYIRYADGTTYPGEGWLTGSILDIRNTIRAVSVPRDRIEACVDIMKDGIMVISTALHTTDDGVRGAICSSMKQAHSRQTYEMASLVLLNAGVFYEDLASCRTEFKPTEGLKILGILDQDTVVKAWRQVRELDYAPIYDTAISILSAIPARTAADILDAISSVVSRIAAMKVTRSGDVYGTLYQSMLYDRKKAAAFYTRPEAAALLAGLVMPENVNTENLRIADFACGTGMLLTAAYNHIINHTTDMVDHKHIMENIMYGYDIMPTATHLTVSNLAGLYPNRIFDDTHIYTLPIGRSVDGGYHLGSLGLLTAQTILTSAGVRQGGHGETHTNIVAIPDESCDYILINPPFVRATNHGGGREDPVPPFAVFGITPEEQLEMAETNSKLYKNTCSHGHAGLGSYFAAIADKKLKPDGVVGLILPNTMTSNSAWEGVRAMLNDNYDNITLVLVGHGLGTYSSDTDMNEVVLIGRKHHTDSPRIKLVLLDKMPQSRLDAMYISKAIRNTTPVRLECGLGHTSIQVGDVIVGRSIDCPVEDGKWWTGRVSDITLLQFVYGLVHGAAGIQTTFLDTLAVMGKHVLDIIGYKHDGSPQGPFNKLPFYPDPTYPCLWSNKAATQRSVIVKPDTALEAKHDATPEHVDRVWRTATHTYLNQQVRYTSQRLIAAYTEDASLGGRSWPNVMLHNVAHNKAFVVWCNSMFGVLCYWAVAGSQQTGRGMMSRTAFRTLRVLDFRQLTDKQLVKFDTLFDEICTKEMLPINRLDEDQTRQKLDRAILDILNVEVNLDDLYQQIVREPQFARNDIGVG